MANITDEDKIWFKWADICICQRLDTSDASYALYPFYHIRQPDLWIIILTLSGGTLCKVWAAHFYGQGIFLTQAYYGYSAWGTSTNFDKKVVWYRNGISSPQNVLTQEFNF